MNRFQDMLNRVRGGENAPEAPTASDVLRQGGHDPKTTRLLRVGPDGLARPYNPQDKIQLRDGDTLDTQIVATNG